ncbi:MAG: mechanosensitive ion channel [Deltaproteobacteria bacterium]|nr:mechanosensitive ion channel [Deltaproteobacteria bacterium]
MPLAPEHLAFAVSLVLALLVVVATIVNRFAPERRARLRTPALLAAAYVLLALMLLGARASDAATAVRWLDFAARLAGGFAAVTLGALLAVDVILPRLRLPFPSIAADLLAALGYGVVTAVAIANTGIDTTSAVAGGTVVAAVLTISLQSTLGNVIGGVALQLDGSVHVGDWIQLENGRQGRVSAIRWRQSPSTRATATPSSCPTACCSARPSPSSAAATTSPTRTARSSTSAWTTASPRRRSSAPCSRRCATAPSPTCAPSHRSTACACNSVTTLPRAPRSTRCATGSSTWPATRPPTASCDRAYTRRCVATASPWRSRPPPPSTPTSTTWAGRPSASAVASGPTTRCAAWNCSARSPTPSANNWPPPLASTPSPLAR